MDIKLDMLPILSWCCQLKFLLITDDHIHTSHNDEALVSASIIWSSFQFSLLALTIDCNIFEGSEGVECRQFDSSSDYIIYMKPTVSFRTVHLISYLKKKWQWPIISRLIFNDTEMKSLKMIETENTELVKKVSSI